MKNGMPDSYILFFCTFNVEKEAVKNLVSMDK